jgi:NADH:ubiquinone oxidoreductase subunit F (NADH-binding)
MGGYFAGLLSDRAGQLPLSYDAFSAEGSGLGCGAVTVLGSEHCPVGCAAQVMAYFDQQNSGRCGSCFNGTAAMSGVLSALVGGIATSANVQSLENWSVTLRGRGACATIDGAANVARSLLREFADDVAAHLQNKCPVCAELDMMADQAPLIGVPDLLPEEEPEL